jgi:hypothetical protein
MSRLVIACVLFGSWCHAASSSKPLSPANATRYAAKVKYLKVDGGNQIMAVETEITGLKGTTLKTTLGGKNGLTLKLEIQDVPGSKPSQYLAHFELLETKRDKVIVLSAPTIVTTVGHPAKLMVGQEKGDRIEVDLTVREIASAAIESKATSDKPAKSKVTEKLTLGGEVYFQGADTDTGLGPSLSTAGGIFQSSSLINLGGFYDFDEHFHFLFSAGYSLAGDKIVPGYLGLQYTW